MRSIKPPEKLEYIMNILTMLKNTKIHAHK